MNTLLYRYGSICENDIIDAFNEYGIAVYEETAEIYNKLLTSSERVDLLGKRLLERDYAFVFSINYFPDISSVCQIVGIPYLCLIVDSPVLELYSNTISNSCNRIFLFDSDLYNEFYPYNPDGIFYMPLASNVKRWDEVISNSTLDFHADVSFVGSLYTEKCGYDKLIFTSPYTKGYVEGIIEAQLKIYGYFFVEEMLSDAMTEEILNAAKDIYRFPEGYRCNDRALLAQLYIGTKITVEERQRLFDRLSKKFDIDIYTGSDLSKLSRLNGRGFAKTLTEMPLIFNQSIINLNPTAKSIRAGIPLRIFDILGCGGFLISNYQKDLPMFFDINEHLVTYDSLEDLEYKTQYYLEHPKERMEIARNGYEYVKNNHTYVIRLGQIIAKAFEDKKE